MATKNGGISFSGAPEVFKITHKAKVKRNAEMRSLHPGRSTRVNSTQMVGLCHSSDFYLAEMHGKHSPSPCRRSRYGPTGVHQHTPAVPSGRMTLYWFVKAAVSTVRHEHSFVFMLSCLFLCRQLLLIARGRWGQTSQRETQKDTM